MINYGCLPPKVDIRDYKIDAKKAGVTYFPSSFSLKHPKVKNQGQVNSCVAHATSSILEYYANSLATLSTNFIYGIQKKKFGRTSGGMYLLDACKIVKEYGDMLEADCPGNTEVPKCWAIAESALADKKKAESAQKFKIDSYYACVGSNDIKYALMTYGPVLCCFKWFHEYKTTGLDHVITFNKSVDYGYHAVIIYGWNEKGWLVQNSWGPTFGKSGCFILRYEDTLAILREARVLIDYPNPDEIDALKKPLALPWFVARFINVLLNTFKKEK